MNKALIISLSVAVSLFGHRAWAGDDRNKAPFKNDFKASAVDVGPAIVGPAVSASDFPNHVVLLEFWDVNPASLASLSRLADWQRQHQEEGLIIVASEAKDASADEIKKIAAEKALKFTLVSGCVVTGAEDLKGLPHCLLFDHTGRCVYRGSPAQAETKLREALAAAPFPALAGKEFKKLGMLASALKKGTSPGAVLKQAQTQVYLTDAETADEAQFIVAGLNAYGQNKVAAAKTQTDKDPVGGLVALKKLAADWSGTAVSAAANQILSELLQDKKFNDLAAGEALQKILELESQLTNTELDPASSTFKAKNSKTLNLMAYDIRALNKRYADTKAAAQVRDLADHYKLDISDKSTMDGYTAPGSDAGRDAGRTDRGY